MQRIVHTIVEQHWGDVASVAALVVTIVGFVVTIWNVVRSRGAAEKAEEAARRARDTMQHFDTIAEVSGAVVTMEEIKGLHRNKEWHVALYKYDQLIKKLIAIRESDLPLPDDHRASMTGAIVQLRGICKKLERCVEGPSPPPNVAKLNDILSNQADTLAEVFSKIRSTSGGSSNGRREDSEAGCSPA